MWKTCLHFDVRDSTLPYVTVYDRRTAPYDERLDPHMDEEERKRLEEAFANLDAESPAVQQEVEERLREKLARQAREHSRLLAASREVAQRRVVR